MQNGVNIDVSVDRGVDILRNDVDAILEQVINSNFIKNARHSTFQPGQYQRAIATMWITDYDLKCLLIPSSDVIALRTGVKRRPGKELTIYIGVVVAILVISYELRKDISFILICDKDWNISKIFCQSDKLWYFQISLKICILFGIGFGDRFSLRISLLLVCIGLAGLYVEIINAFDYLQGARIAFQSQMCYK